MTMTFGLANVMLRAIRDYLEGSVRATGLVGLADEARRWAVKVEEADGTFRYLTTVEAVASYIRAFSPEF